MGVECSRTPLSRIALSRISRCPVRKSLILEYPHTKPSLAVPESHCPGQILLGFGHPEQRGASCTLNRGRGKGEGGRDGPNPLVACTTRFCGMIVFSSNYGTIWLLHTSMNRDLCSSINILSSCFSTRLADIVGGEKIEGIG